MFEDADAPASPLADEPAAVSPPPRPRARRSTAVLPAPPSPELIALAARLPPRLRLGTSSWHFPGWAGLVWAGDHAESKLSKEGLSAYGQHPLLGTVSLDRAFYRPLTASQYAKYAAQVPPGFVGPGVLAPPFPHLVTAARLCQRLREGKARSGPQFMRKVSPR